jgi:hypothetical protein
MVYRRTGGEADGLYGVVSDDGYHWRELDERLIPKPPTGSMRLNQPGGSAKVPSKPSHDLNPPSPNSRKPNIPNPPIKTAQITLVQNKV